MKQNESEEEYDPISALDIGKSEAEEEEEFEDPNIEQLRSASDLLKKSMILFEYMAEPTFIKTISQRERKAMHRQVDQIYAFVTQLQEQLDLEGEL